MAIAAHEASIAAGYLCTTETNENPAQDDFFDFDTEPPSQELERSKVILETIGITS